MKSILILYCICIIVAALDLEVEKVDIEYYNPKYFNLVNLTMRRKRRRGPYIVNAWADCKYAIGNNLTIKWSMYENIGGHFVLTPIHLEYGFCDFFKDKIIGKMIVEQLPKNFTCPIPATLNKFENLVYHLDNRVPYIPFTFSSLFVRVFVLIEGYINQTDLGLRWKFHFLLKQKLQDKYRKH